MPKKVSVSTEKIINNKSEQKIKKDLNDIVIESFYVDRTQTAKSITRDSNNDYGNTIANTYVPFFYLNNAEISAIYKKETKDNILAYINSIKDQIAYALDFPFKQQFLLDTIDAIDRPKEGQEVKN